jgi:release factor glutamine methyltransferase
MQISAWLHFATDQLTAIDTARLDALILLEDCTGKDRAWILANPEHLLTLAQVKKLKNLLTQRAQHVPLAYIRGHTEFYGRSFVINPAVLEPRPESEVMIDLLKRLAETLKVGNQKSPQLRIADIGTGSGALGITAALELPSSAVELLEIDPHAASVAKLNVDKFTLSLPVIESDLLSKSTHS